MANKDSFIQFNVLVGGEGGNLNYVIIS